MLLQYLRKAVDARTADHSEARCQKSADVEVELVNVKADYQARATTMRLSIRET
jgi:hypothetical protein